MMLEPAPQRAGDAPRTAREQGTPAPPPHPPPASGGSTRLPAPAADARLRTEREQWRRRRDLERQLHDGAALRISALTLQLGLFRHRAAEGGPELDVSIDGLQDELHAVLQELRDVAAQIYPPLLDEAGLGPALREVAGRLAAPVRVDAPADRFGPAAEGAAYFAVTGCLEAADPTAAGLHVVVRRDGADLVVEVAGVDLHHAAAMVVPVRRLGGTIDVAGGPDAGTITVRIPCE
ncbi:sensor histidine kinase [Pseudonocardia sichuanensis]|uniref:histidine kinase n=1 Tax=Pseudonocardia kunmingensis TaxID=630975 RepID=A0A543DZF7_9PSEU|nr:histidine kinase [Pseudonocardia kunmingensis]TQM14708.1 histidine kinase [Pseudonocardia kunmingensis]